MKRTAEQPWTPARVAAEMAKVSDLMAPALEAVVGYRAQCEAAGFSPTVAEFMALQYHAALLRQPVPEPPA